MTIPAESCYRYETEETKTIKEHIEMAKMYGGLLAAIPDQETNNLINERLIQVEPKKNHFFIGVNDADTEDQWMNADGSNVTWTNWYTASYPNGKIKNILIF